MTTFEKELKAATTIIDVQAMRDFLYQYANEEIGVDRSGNATTLRVEVAKVIELVTRACVDDGSINYYRSYQARNTVEMTEEERKARADRNYIIACRKLMWLNLMGNKYTGRYFVLQGINRESVTDARMVCDAFEFIVRNYNNI